MPNQVHILQFRQLRFPLSTSFLLLSILFLSQSRFVRLGGRYGKCVKNINEVKSYYYDGSYTTDVRCINVQKWSSNMQGCLRSCYQDEVLKECTCMDSRYPKDPDAKACELPDRTFIFLLSFHSIISRDRLIKVLIKHAAWLSFLYVHVLHFRWLCGFDHEEGRRIQMGALRVSTSLH